MTADDAGDSNLRGEAKKRVLFYRDFRHFTGGHLKVWDYFNHVDAALGFEARIAFTEQSVWDKQNPWMSRKNQVVRWQPQEADILFLGAAGWKALPQPARANYPKPVINLIQHPRHAEAGTELRSFLRNRAVRICVSAEVAEAIKATGESNGPVFVIPNGLDIAGLSPGKNWDDRSTEVLISGQKAPDLARQVVAALTKANVKAAAITEWMPRSDYLQRLSDAKVAVILPRPVEGFFLPALEGMACGAIVVCPDCIGNRSFCEDERNCFRPAYDARQIASAVITAMNQTNSAREEMRNKAKELAHRHSLENERRAFHSILAELAQPRP